MSLQEKINILLQKLNDPNLVLSSEKELKSLIINQIDDGDKLMILIECIGTDKDIS